MLPNPYRVFVSHSSHDEGVARLIKRCVGQFGGTAILAEDDLRVGGPIRSGITELIRSCQEMIVLISPEFMQSEWLRHEFGVAEGCGIDISPILYRLAREDIERHPLWSNMFNDRHHVQMKDIDKYFEQLQISIKIYETNSTRGSDMVSFLTDSLDEVHEVVQSLRALHEQYRVITAR